MVDRESAFEVLLKASEEVAVVNQSNQNIQTTQSTQNTQNNQNTPAKKGIGSKLLKAVFTAATATLATAAGTAVSDAVTGKKTKSSKTMGQKIIKNTTSAATRTLTRDILGNLLK